MSVQLPDTIFALDFGLRRIGIATGSGVTGTSGALTTLVSKGGEPDWVGLDALIDEWKPQLLVVGLPYNMDGSESEMSGKARSFALTLEQRYHLPVELVDERLTSSEAGKILKEQRRSGLRKKKVKKTEIDSLAACLIAESWLQAQN